MKNFLRSSLAKVMMLAFIAGMVSPALQVTYAADAAPQVSNLQLSTTNFVPQNNPPLAISFNLSTTVPAATFVMIKNSQGFTEATLGQIGQVLSSGQKNFTWNGIGKNNTIVTNGTYTLQVVSYTNNPVIAEANLNFNVTNSTTNIGAPTITITSISPSPFNPTQGQSTTISYNLFSNASQKFLSFEIFYPNGTKAGQLNQFPVSNGSGTTTWNGRDFVDNILAPGTYKIVATATNSANEGSLSATDTKYVDIINQSTSNAPKFTSAPTFSTITFNPNTTSVNVCFTVDKGTNATVQILNTSGTVISNLTGTTVAGVQKCIPWTGSGSTDNAVYTAKVIVTDPQTSLTANATTTNSVTVQSTSPQNTPVSGVSVENSPFNPQNNELARLNVTVDRQACVKVEILDNGNNVIRTMTSSGGTGSGFTCQSNENLLSSGTTQFTWNGTAGGNFVSSGNYTVRVSGRNAAGTGNTATAAIQVGTSNSSCNNLIIDTYSTNVNTSNDTTGKVYFRLNQGANVTVTIKDGGTTIKTLSPSNQFYNSGTSYYNLSWDGRRESGTYMNSGSYTYQVRAEQSGNSNCFQNSTGTIYVNTSGTGGDGGYNDPDVVSTDENLVKNVTVLNEVFNPRNGEKSTIRYELTRRADVKVQVMDGDRVVKTISTISNQSSGTYSYTWDGRDYQGNVAPDRLYQFRVTAEDGNNRDADRAYVEVDTDGIIIGFPESARCAGYRDVSTTSPFCKAIELMSRNNIFDGYSDGTFRPYQKINRAETTKVVVLALGYTTESSGTGYFGRLFSDTSATAWYAKYLDVAQKNDIINGYPDGSFKPSKTINRVELLKVFLEATQIGTSDCGYGPFLDTPYEAGNKWYMPYACFVKENDLLGGENKNNLRPAESMTRGDVADLFYEFDTRGLFDQSPGYRGSFSSNYNNNNNNSTAYNNCLDTHTVSYCQNMYGYQTSNYYDSNNNG